LKRGSRRGIETSDADLQGGGVWQGQVRMAGPIGPRLCTPDRSPSGDHRLYAIAISEGVALFRHEGNIATARGQPTACNSEQIRSARRLHLARVGPRYRGRSDQRALRQSEGNRLRSAARLSRRTKMTDCQAGQSSRRGWSFIAERVRRLCVFVCDSRNGRSGAASRRLSAWGARCRASCAR
jgi:hypothetical protein